MKTYRNGNSAKFFSYAGNGIYFEELSTHILNGIVVGGWHVSSALVADRLAATRAKRQSNKKRKKPKTVMTFLKWNIDIKNPVTSFECARVNKSIILDKMRKQESTHQRVASQQKHPRHNKLRFQA